MYFTSFIAIVTLATHIPFVSAGPGDAVVQLCHDKDLGGKCTNREVTFGRCNDFGDDKYGDKGSSFLVSSSSALVEMC